MRTIHTLISQLEGVLDTIGIYPKENCGVPRTEKQDGWNEGVMEVCSKIESVLSTEDTEENMDKAKQLLLLADIGWQDEEGFFLNLNDSFFYACADSEKVPDDQIEEVARLLVHHGFDGIMYWTSKVRGYYPTISQHEKDVKRIELTEGKIKKKK